MSPRASTFRGPAARRAFTLLEIVLATAMGAMVIMVSLALLGSMERLERPLAVRQQELSDLHRARIVMQRAISSLVMSDTTPPVNPNQRRFADKSATDTPKSAFEATAEATASKQLQQQRPPARLSLDADQTDELKAMLQAVGIPADSASGIQRLELVIDTPPIAPSFRAELGDVIAATYAHNSGSPTDSSTGSKTGSTSSSGSSSGMSSGTPASGLRSTGASLPGQSGSSSLTAASSGSNDAASLRSRLSNTAQSGNAGGSDPTGRRTLSLGNRGSQSGAPQGALRGAFEIRPMLTQASQADRQAGKPILYQLWWTPLPAVKDTPKLSAAANAPASNQEDDPRTQEPWGERVLLADNLVKCNWQFFSSGEKRKAHSAVWERELPAYVEFEVQTKTGLYENWMFEVGWTKGQELASRDLGAGGGPGAGGVAGADGGTAVAVPTGAGAPGSGVAGSGSPQNATGANRPGPAPASPGGGTRPHISPGGPSSGPRYDIMPTRPK